MAIKHYTALLTTLVWVNCAPIEQTGQVAHFHGDSSDSSSAQPLDLDISIRDSNREVGELRISGGPLISGQEGKITIEFIARQALNTYEDTSGGSGSNNNNSGSGGGGGMPDNVCGNPYAPAPAQQRDAADSGHGYSTTLFPELRLSFDDNVTDVSCADCDDNLIHYASRSGKYIQLKDMKINQIVTLKFKITASESFKLTAHLQGKDIDGRGEGTVRVELNEKQKATEALKALLGKAKRYFNSKGEIKSVYPQGKVRLVPLTESGQEAGYLLMDYPSSLKISGSSRKVSGPRQKARFTFISTGKLGGDDARLYIGMPSKLHVHRPVLLEVDKSHRFTRSSTLFEGVSGKLDTMSHGEHFYIELELMPLASLESPFYFHVTLTDTKFDAYGTDRVSDDIGLLQHNIKVEPYQTKKQGLFANKSFLATIYESGGGKTLVMKITVWKDMGNPKYDKFRFYCGVNCEINNISSRPLPWAKEYVDIDLKEAKRVQGTNHKWWELNLKDLPEGRTFYVSFRDLSAEQNTETYTTQVEYLRGTEQKYKCGMLNLNTCRKVTYERVGQSFSASFKWGN